MMQLKNIIIICMFMASLQLVAGFQETGEFIEFATKLSLRAVENQTVNSTFKVFYASGDPRALLVPQSTFIFKPGELLLQKNENLCIQCVKGSFLPIYIKDEGKVSGQAFEGFHGPYYLSMWLNYPDVSEDQKQYVRYIVKNGSQAEFAVRINLKGDCQIIALSNMQLLA